MERIYAIYCTVELIDPPQWLSNFRAKYDEPHDFHITLKQSAYISEADFPEIKEKLEAVLGVMASSRGKMQLVFDRLELDDHDADSGLGWMYIFANNRSQQLDDLQKRLREELAEYSDYRSKESKEYEYNFRPHITIARELDANRFAHAVKELPIEFAVVGRITGITLACVKEATLEQAKDPRNLTFYSLDN